MNEEHIHPPSSTTMSSLHSLPGADVASRMKSRETDISESLYLLLELGTQEPIFLHCLQSLQGICMAQGVKLAKKGTHDQDPETKKWSTQATDKFQKHIDKYWVPFAQEALRMFFVCGFCAWHVRRLPSTGDIIPEAIPLGTFTWGVELRAEKERRREREMHTNTKMKFSYTPSIVDGQPPPRKGKDWVNPSEKGGKETKKATDDPESKFNSDGKPKEACTLNTEGIEIGHPAGSKRVREDNDTKYVQYRVNMKDGGLKEQEIYIYDFVAAKYDITMNSMMYSTVPSPMAHLLIDYKNLRQAQIRRSYADSWNCQAHLVTTFKPGNSSNNVPEWKGFNYGHHDLDTRVPNADGNPLSLIFDTNGENEIHGRDCLIKKNVLQGRPHDPVVYTLPKHSEVVQMVDLKPVEDIPMLLEKYSRDVAFVLGIPPNFVVSKSNMSSSTSSSQQGENTHTFTTNAQSICRHLERLLSDVHEVIYGDPADFSIVPMPRVTIETMEDIKSLMETGLILPEKCVRLVDILLGAQNLPMSGDAGGEHARKVQKLMLEPKPAAGSSSSGGAKKKSSSSAKK